MYEKDFKTPRQENKARYIEKLEHLLLEWDIQNW